MDTGISKSLWRALIVVAIIIGAFSLIVGYFAGTLG